MARPGDARRTFRQERALARGERRGHGLSLLGGRDMSNDTPPRHQMDRFEYRWYLASPQWAATRARFIKRECADCGSSAALELHHLSYERIGCELPTDLVTLCRKCHARRHDKVERHRRCDGAGTIRIEVEALMSSLKVMES